MNEFKSALLDACRQADNILITSHMSPDDDSVSSTLACKYFLQSELGVDASIIYEGSSSHRWNDFSGFEQLTFVEDLSESLQAADVILFVDANELSRFTQQEVSLSAKTFCLDHHVTEGHDFDFAVIDETKTSASQVVYEVLYEGEVDAQAAKYLLLGILGDTGNFRYINKQKAGVFLIVKDLVESGDIDIDAYQQGYGGMSQNEFTVFSKLMANATVANHDSWPTHAYSYITKEQAEGCADEDISGAAHVFVSWARSIKGVEWTFVLTPRSTGLTACSFRSVSVNVRHIAEGLDVGGGHDRAAGARFEVSPQEALKQILDYISNNKPEFT